MGEPGSTISLSYSMSIDNRTVSAYNSIELFAGAGGMALGMRVMSLRPQDKATHKKA